MLVKQLGVVSIPLFLEALGVHLVLVEDDPVALERARNRLEPRQTNALRVVACLWGRSGKQREVSRRWIKQVAAKGGRARAAALSPKQRSQQARKASVVRWSEIKSLVRAAAKPSPPPTKDDRAARLRLDAKPSGRARG